MKRNTSPTELEKRCSGRWGEIHRTLAPDLIPALNRAPRHGPCPKHGGKDGFRFFDDYAKTGGGICNSCGAFPTGKQLLILIHDWSPEKVVREIERVLSDLAPSTHGGAAHDVEDPQDLDQRKLDAIRNLVDESVPLDDPAAEPARLYLANRGLSLVTYPNALRFHVSLPYFDGRVLLGTFPGLLALIESDEGVVSVHRTFITSGGEKAPVSAPKKLMPSPRHGLTTGAAVRLDNPGTALAVAEGVETALAVNQSTKLPTWATVSANGMERLIVPPTVKELWIAANRDRSGTGERSAEVLRRRLAAKGCQVRVRLPPYPIPQGRESIDWLDVLNIGSTA